jgi:glucokinase
MENQSDPIILAGDVGGSKTVLAAFSQVKGENLLLARGIFASREFPALSAVIERFMVGQRIQPAAAAFGVAGPVTGGRVQATNLPWLVDESDLSCSLGGIPVHLLNDLEALAHAVPVLPSGEVETIHAGMPVDHGALAVIAPGTGLGEAFLVREGEGYRAVASEGGHADFAPNDELQAELLAYLRPRFGHVSWERVCSGSGLPNIYAFFKDSAGMPEPPWLAAQLAAGSDPTPVIVRSGLENTSAICRAALDLFVSVLAAEAGNLALKVLANGGVYFGGGLPPRILPLLRAPAFSRTFAAKGRFSRLLESIPLRVITDPEAGLWGAARFAMKTVH